jgi:hypothetical protein
MLDVEDEDKSKVYKPRIIALVLVMGSARSLLPYR